MVVRLFRSQNAIQELTFLVFDVLGVAVVGSSVSVVAAASGSASLLDSESPSLSLLSPLLPEPVCYKTQIKQTCISTMYHELTKLIK